MTWMDLEIVILSEVSQTEKEKYRLYVESKKNDTNELTYKTETDSETNRTNLWLPGRRVCGRDSWGVWN